MNIRNRKLYKRHSNLIISNQFRIDQERRDNPDIKQKALLNKAARLEQERARFAKFYQNAMSVNIQNAHQDYRIMLNVSSFFFRELAWAGIHTNPSFSPIPDRERIMYIAEQLVWELEKGINNV